MPADNETLVATVAKNSREQIQIRLVTFHGVPCTDARVFVGSGEAEGPKPTKKGLAVNVSKLDELLAVLATARREAVRLGLMPEHADPTTGSRGRS